MPNSIAIGDYALACDNELVIKTPSMTMVCKMTDEQADLLVPLLREVMQTAVTTYNQ